MSQRPQKPAPVVVKRPPDQRRKLPPELEAFARSDEEKLRIRRPRVDRGNIRDPREGYTVAGVSNRDARAVYDVRSVAMRALWDDGAADEHALAELGQHFHDVLRLELWEARRLTSFAAFSEEVIGVPVARAQALAADAAERTGEPTTPLTEVATALWLRTEAGLYEGDEHGRARIRTSDRGLVLRIEVGLADASTALAGVGARHLPLARSLPSRDEPRFDRDEPRFDRDEPRFDRDEPRFDRDEPRGTPHADAETRGPGASSAREQDEDEPRDEHTAANFDVADEVADGDVGEQTGEGKTVVGGARLLTRKPQRDEGEGGEHWGRHEPRAERPQFGADRGPAPRDRGADRPRSRDRGGDRPRQSDDRRPQFGGQDRPRHADRPRSDDRGSQDRGFNRNDGRASFNDRPRERSNERPRSGDAPRGDRGDRPRFGGGQREERPRFGGQDQRGGFDNRGGGKFGGGGGGSKFGGGGSKFGSGGGSKFGGGGAKFGGEKRGGFTQGGFANDARGGGSKFGGDKRAGKGFGARTSFSGTQNDAPKPGRRDDRDD